MSFAYLNNKDKINTELLDFNNRLHTINTILKAKIHVIAIKSLTSHTQYTHNKTTKQIENLSNFLNGNLKQKQNSIIAKYSED